MSEPSLKGVRTLDSVFASTRSPSQADALQNDTEDSSTDGEQIKGKEVPGAFPTMNAMSNVRVHLIKVHHQIFHFLYGVTCHLFKLQVYFELIYKT